MDLTQEVRKYLSQVLASIFEARNTCEIVALAESKKSKSKKSGSIQRGSDDIKELLKSILILINKGTSFPILDLLTHLSPELQIKIVLTEALTLTCLKVRSQL